MNTSRVRVVVADDDTPMREALADLITSQPDLELVGVAEDHAELVTVATQSRPDVVLMDVRMPGGEAAATVQTLRTRAAASVVAVSAFSECSVILACLTAGASGYLIKGTPDQEILAAVDRARHGQLSMPTSLLARCLGRLLRDLDSARRTEAALRKSEGTFHDLLDRAPTGLILVDAHGRIRLANAGADRMFGRSVDGLVGLTASELWPARYRSAFLALLGQAHAERADGRPGLLKELVGLRGDGSHFQAVAEMRSIDLAGEELVAVFVRDLSEYRDVETRYQRLFESSPESLLIVDGRGVIELVNSRAEELFGYQRGELLAQPLDLVLPGSGIEVFSVQEHTDLSPSPWQRSEGGPGLVGRRKDGATFPVDVRLSPLEDEHGPFVVAAVRDVSQQRRKEQVLEESFQFLREMEAEHERLLAHLVRAQEDERKRISVGIHDDTLQAMTAASLRVQQLRRRLQESRDLEVLDKLEETIQLSIARLRHLMFDLRPPSWEQDGLAAALHTYLDQLRGEGGPDFHLESNLRSELSPDTQTIAYRIAQEALTNVWRHANASLVTVRLTEVDKGCLVVIEDDGKGYDVMDCEGRPGHLGLTLMQERAHIAGGWCRVDSSPGSGTTVQFWIPRTADSRELARSGAASLAGRP